MTAALTVPTGLRSRAGVRLGLLLGALTALFLLTGTGPAQAHDALLRSNPATDAVVPTAPTTVELEFSNQPVPLGTEVLVLGPDGETVSTGPAEIRDTTVVQELSASLPAGAYTVEWRSTSSDGHPLAGSYGFTVAAGTSPSAAATTPSAASLEAAGAGTPTQPAGDGPSVGWVLAGAVVLGAVAVLLARRLRSRS